MKKLLALCIVLLTLTTSAFAQFGFPPNTATLLRLRDDKNTAAIVIVKADGSYLLTFQVDALRIESSGKMIRLGDMVVLAEQTQSYQVVLSGNTQAGTGKAVVTYFGVGTFVILDQTAN